MRTPQSDALPGPAFSFFDTTPLLPSEDPAEFNELCRQYVAHFQPGADLTETRHVNEMINAEWNLRRIRRYQQQAFARKSAEIAQANPQESPEYLDALTLEALLARGSTYLTSLAQEKQYRAQYEQAYKGWAKYRTDSLHTSLMPTRNERAELKVLFDQAEKELAAARPPKPAKPAETPRNAPCPCGSGEKYKRCCGKNAPPVLSGQGASPYPIDLS